ncbi:MAG: hypothetical protein KC636_31555 [Myxococcales bacterium]|nr:hypothetical protein [Myxococcales bacterium]
MIVATVDASVDPALLDDSDAVAADALVLPSPAGPQAIVSRKGVTLRRALVAASLDRPQFMALSIRVLIRRQRSTRVERPRATMYRRRCAWLAFDGSFAGERRDERS